MSLYLRLIASRTTSLHAQEILASISDVRETLASNKALTPNVWRTLWKSKPNVQIASTLVARQMDNNTIDQVLDREKRVTVLEALVKKCYLSDAHARRLMDSPLFSTNLANSWFDAKTAPSGVSFDLAMRANAERAIRFATLHRELSIEEMLSLLRKSSTYYTKGISTFVDTYPEFLEVLAKEEHLGLRTAALCSRHMFDQEIILDSVRTANTKSWWQWSEMVLAIVHSPNTTPDTVTRLTGLVQELSKVQAGARSVSMRIEAAAVARLGEFPFAVLRPWEYADSENERALIDRYTSRNMEWSIIVNKIRKPQVALVSNHQDAKVAKDVKDWHINELRAFSLTNHPPVGSLTALISYLDSELDSLGRSGWETAITLLRSTFDGNVSDLLSVTKSLI
jgi:hypothetical protein